MESIHLTYNMIFANFMENFEIKTPIGFIVYIIATQFIIVIMLNILISIVSDTYKRVQLDMKGIELRSRCNMLYNIELLFFWNRKISKQRILQCIEYKHLTEDIYDKNDTY